MVSHANMIKPKVLVVGSAVFWQHICPVLAGAGCIPVSGGPPHQVSVAGGARVDLCVVGDPGGAALPSAPQLRKTLGIADLPMLLVPKENPGAAFWGKAGYDDVASPDACGAEIRFRVGTLVERSMVTTRDAEWKAETAALQAELRAARRELAAASLPVEQRGKLDPLTGLPCNPWLRGEIARQCGSPGPWSLLFLDLDRFKPLNDRYGHVAGDKVLAETAKRINGAVPDEAVLGRFGGEEFVVLVREEADGAVRIAEEMRRRVADPPFSVAGESLAVTASIGVATALQGADAEPLVRAADRARYSAKAAGRNKVLHVDDLARSALESGGNPEAEAFEAMTQVMTERMGNVIASRGRHILNQVKQEAEVDPLTGLFNRRYLDRRLGVERQKAVPLTVALLDIDHFGQVNKTYGWPTGDRVLKEVAARVGHAVRASDWVARYGGEEIVVVMPVTPLVDAIPVAERVRQSVGASPYLGVAGEQVRVTASIGLAEASADGSAEEVFQRASQCLLQAKDGGRNLVVSTAGE